MYGNEVDIYSSPLVYEAACSQVCCIYLTLLIYQVIQKLRQTLKMNNSKTNKNIKMWFAPNEW